LSLGCAGGGLRLLGLLYALSSASLLLAGCDGSLAGSLTGLWSLRSSLLNHVEGSTDDGTLVLNGTARALLRNFLYTPLDLPQTPATRIPYLRDTLLVLSTEENGPGDATGVLALKEERFGLSVLESENLAVTTDVDLAL
jgi:hypothetical protein